MDGNSQSSGKWIASGDVMEIYEVIAQYAAAVGQQPVAIGAPGRCRYCGTENSRKFQHVAHAFPEALGNRWLTSLDECDDCNRKFSACDATLTEAFGSFLTLGGVPRKKDSTRKFGRSSGDVTVAHERKDGGRHQSVSMKGDPDELGFEVARSDEFWRIRFPMPNVAFVPARAYKAVAKMGFALIPERELAHFESQRRWLLDSSDGLQVRDHHVVASFGSIGNSPMLVTGTLLRRRDLTVPLPYMIFVGCIGSICLQIAIKSDVLDDHVPSDAVLGVNLQWVTAFGGSAEAPAVRIVYDHRVEWDWSASTSTAQPVAAMILTFNNSTQEGALEPVFR